MSSSSSTDNTVYIPAKIDSNKRQREVYLEDFIELKKRNYKDISYIKSVSVH